MSGLSTEAELATFSITTEAGSRPFFFRKGSSDESVIEQTFVRRHYDLSQVGDRYAELMAYIRTRAADGTRPLIVDAGANIGASAVFFALAFGNARIVAIEPDATNVDILRKNIAGLDVEVLKGALASAPGRSLVIDPGQGYWAFRTVDAAADQAGVPNVTIPEVYARHQPDCFPFIVKIDIEGGEKGVFAGSAEWIQQTPVIVIELHDWLFPKQRTASTFLRAIAGLERDFISLGENIYSIAYDLI
jgi:FkbM family methyltransferase